jgi:hypothetical protein
VPEKSSRPAAHYVQGGPFEILPCDCVDCCRAWHVVESGRIICVTQTRAVAFDIVAALLARSAILSTARGGDRD